MADEEVVCTAHGRQPMTFVCTHIAHALVDGTSSTFLVRPELGEAYPLAWCESCETMIAGGEWTEQAERAADFKLLCAACYLEARDLAVDAGTFRDLSTC